MRFIIPVLVLCAVAAMPGLARAEMVLRSADIAEGQTLSNAQVYSGFGCTGDNISPDLSWGGVPDNAKSLAVTIYDPDAPTGSGWWHWVVFNMPASATFLETGASGEAMPEGSIESMTDYGAPGFGGACPPPGDAPHHYIVTLYALDIEKLDLGEAIPAAQVGYFLNAHKIETASITALYGR